MESIQQNDKILLLWDKSFDLQSSEFQAEALKNKFNSTINFENVERLDLGEFKILWKILWQLLWITWEAFNLFLIWIIFFFNHSASYENSSFTLILLKISQNKDAQFLANLLKLLTPKGRIVATSQNPVEFSENLKLAGFVNIIAKDNGN